MTFTIWMGERGAGPCALALLLAACSSGPPPDTRCRSDLDCADDPEGPYCDRNTARCAGPCASDLFRSYVCMDGERMYCADDLALPCTVCPNVCGSGTYCESASATCAPAKEPGEPCSTREECSAGYCHEQLCGAANLAPCSAETCDGVCAVSREGETFCIRPGCGISNCASETAGGFEWLCVRLGYEATAPSYCVPREQCFWMDPCGSLRGSTCGMSCPETGPCYNYCVPDGLR